MMTRDSIVQLDEASRVSGSSPMHDSSRPTIGLLDHMGYGNLGDAAIQEAVIANIKKRVPNAEFIGFSLIPDDTQKRHGIPSHPIRWLSPKLEQTGSQACGRRGVKLRLKSGLKNRPLLYACAKSLVGLGREACLWVRSYRVLQSLDLLIISGGGQLDTTWDGPWAHPYTVFKFSLLAKLARKKVYLLNVGAGPLEHTLGRFFARWAVRFADYRSFRDHVSRERLRNVGVKAETHVYPDPVYALDVAVHLTRTPLGSSMPVVGLNPMSFCDPRIWPRKDESIYREYLEKVTRFSVWLLQQGYDLRVFTTDLGVDANAIADLREGLRKRLPSPEAVCGVFRGASASVQDVLREMSEFDFVVTSKFHGIVFSHLLRKPLIALSYHRKMDIAMQAMGQGRFCADIERFDDDWLIQAFRMLVAESGAIRSACAAAVEANAAALSQQFDRLFLPNSRSWDGAMLSNSGSHG